MATTTVLITGKTFPVKDQIKALGGRWNAKAKGWDVPEAQADAARALVSQAGGPTSAPQLRRRFSRYGSRYTRFSSGAEVFTNARGRCEDAPCCGCCS
jgi:hypothetical protein